MKKIVTWVLVADGHRARILKNEGPNRGLTDVFAEGFIMPNPPTHLQGDDRPGRSHESATTARHAVEGTDLHRETKAQFARELAERLRKAVQGKEMDRIILIAPAKTMGDLRAALDRNVANLVSAEITKDLTHSALDDIAAQVSKVLAV